jgi:hypothetical protein
MKSEVFPYGSKSDKISLGMAVHTYNPSTPRLKQKYHEF